MAVYQHDKPEPELLKFLLNAESEAVRVNEDFLFVRRVLATANGTRFQITFEYQKVVWHYFDWDGNWALATVNLLNIGFPTARQRDADAEELFQALLKQT